MKKLMVLFLACLLLAVGSLAMAEGKDLLDQIRERGTIIIAMEGNWSPWTYHDENDVLTGLEVDIGNLIAEGLGVKRI